MSRLTSGTVRVGTTPKVQTATFDGFGNVSTTTTADYGAQNFGVVSSTNRISGAGYDTAGNMTSWGGYTYAYDKLSRLQTVTGTGVNHTYLYAADGERISDRDNLSPSTKTVTVRDLWGKVLRVYTNSGGTWTWTRDYVYRDGALLTAIDAPYATKRHFHLDHLGSPRLITNASAGAVATHTYYPFGLEAAGGLPDTERMKFTGHEREPYNQDYMHARHYNPATLRFLTPDLLRGDAHRPQTFNLFAYVGGNPMTYVDPFGLDDEEEVDEWWQGPPLLPRFYGYVEVTGSSSWRDWLELRQTYYSWRSLSEGDDQGRQLTFDERVALAIAAGQGGSCVGNPNCEMLAEVASAYDLGFGWVETHFRVSRGAAMTPRSRPGVTCLYGSGRGSGVGRDL